MVWACFEGPSTALWASHETTDVCIHRCDGKTETSATLGNPQQICKEMLTSQDLFQLLLVIDVGKVLHRQPSISPEEFMACDGHINGCHRLRHRIFWRWDPPDVLQAPWNQSMNSQKSNAMKYAMKWSFCACLYNESPGQLFFLLICQLLLLLYSIWTTITLCGFLIFWHSFQIAIKSSFKVICILCIGCSCSNSVVLKIVQFSLAPKLEAKSQQILYHAAVVQHAAWYSLEAVPAKSCAVP